MQLPLEKQFQNVKPGDVGIIGDPIEHSLSPVIQNAAFNTWRGVFGEDGGVAPCYHVFHVSADQLNDSIDLLRQYKLRGFNVTVPHKVAACQLVDRLDPLAKRVGAINTILNSEDGLIGYNTDGHGFSQSLHYDLEFEATSKNVLVLGAGGTARVVVHTLLDMGVEKIILWNRSAGHSADLIASIEGSVARIQSVMNPQDVHKLMGAMDLVVNATSVGLSPNDGLPLDGLVFHRHQSALDVIYHRETEFVRAARAAGARATDGSGMLVHQGAKSFTIWTAAPAPIEVMQLALNDALKKV